MKTRALLLLPLLALIVSGCGSSSVVPSKDEAHTMACRGYVLTIGSEDKTHVDDLVSQAPYEGDSFRDDSILGKMRAAAVTAGSTAGLSDGDYAVFRSVVENVDELAVGQKVLDDGSTMSVTATAMAALDKAVAAVHKLCY